MTTPTPKNQSAQTAGDTAAPAQKKHPAAAKGKVTPDTKKEVEGQKQVIDAQKPGQKQVKTVTGAAPQPAQATQSPGQNLMQDLRALTNLENELKSANQKILAGEEQIKQLTEAHARVLADLMNYRRRVEQEKGETMRFAAGALLLQVLPALNNLEKAFTFIPETAQKESWCQGLTQSFAHLTQSLTKTGLEAIKTVGEKFDPHLHEAMLQGPGAKDIIIAELEKGYLLNGKVLKHAKVSVGDGSAAKK